MNIEKASIESAEWIDKMIKQEFPYTDFTPKKIEERINNPNYAVFVAKQKNIFTGFAEIEIFLEKKEARLNAIFVDDGWRDQKVGTMLLEKVINECKHKRIQKLFLLVKTTNHGAKHLYQKVGMKFEKPHEKEIDGANVEVWAIEI